MNKRQKQQLADFIEQRLDALTVQLMSYPAASDPQSLQPLVAGWLGNQTAFAQDKSFRAGEWAARAIEYLQRVDGDIEQAHSLLLYFRNSLIDACAGKIEGVSDADIRQSITECTDQHCQLLFEYYAQYMREYDSATQRRRKSIVEAVNRPLVLLNAQGFIETTNREFARCLNTTPDALSGRDFLSLCDDKTAGRVRGALRQKPSAQPPKAFVGAVRQGKQQESARFHVQPLFDEAGMRSGAVLCLDMESTENKLADAGLRYVEEHLLGTLPFPVQLIDSQGNVTYSSDAVQTLNVRDYDGKEPLCTFLHRQRTGPQRIDPCIHVFETGLFHMEELSYGSNADTRWYLLLLAPLPDEKGNTTRVVSLVYDMTRRKQLQKQLEAQIIGQQRSSLVAQIAVTVAHQLRNPLSVVLGFAEMMAKGLPPEQYSEAVSRILRNSIRCKDIVENLLDFGKGMPLERRSVDLEMLIRESVRPMLTPAQNRMIEWRLSDRPAPIECVPEQLTQVILSLLDNALRVASMRVTCTVDNKAETVRLRFTDDGPGIPLDMRDRVFEPFFTTRREEGAVGLGLSLARAVAVDYGGTLSVSAPIGGEPNGACLVLQLPKIKSSYDEGQGEPDGGGASAGAAGRRVLIVDDEADLLDLLKTALYMRGYLVDAVGTGMDALAKLKENDYDAVVIDFQLSGAMSGCDVHDHIINEFPHLSERVFFITADTMNYQTRLSLQGTRRPILEKPFLMIDFIAEVERLFQ